MGKTDFIKMAKADPYADIDFEEINDATNLAHDEIKCLKVCFDLFDTKKQEFLSADDLGEIVRAMGFRPTEDELKDLLHEIDEDGSGEIEFGEFCQLCATFLVEDPDMETMKRELKDAFRVYDKEGLGYITTDTLRGLIGELLAPPHRRGARGHPGGARRGRLGLHGLRRVLRDDDDQAGGRVGGQLDSSQTRRMFHPSVRYMPFHPINNLASK